MPSKTRKRATRSDVRRARRWRPVLLGIAAARVVTGIVAIPLAPFLYKNHYMWLVLLRPTKEVLLVGGFFARRGDANLLNIVLAAIPFAVGGVWLFYVLGLAFAREIHAGDLPLGAARILHPDKVKRMEKTLARKGPKIVFLGRLAIFPSAMIAAAAGASHMNARRFLVADGAGAAVSMVEVIGAGYLFGHAYESAGPWLTGLGIAALLAVLFVVGRSLARD